MDTPKALYRKLALAEMVTWTILIIGLVLKYAAGLDVATRIGGSIHGFVFLSYAVVTVLVWVNQGWSFGRGVIGLASAVIPYMTVPFERATVRDGKLEGPWRFRDTDEKPRTLPEKILAVIVRHPLASAIAILVAVAIVFTLLLQAGPPTEWFS
ncbi:DUF3817 domain-containing protein [uncultured Corynebacterium sp.]|uniref:DUF3817 domain-containing protein n=1 Tax=uncultured Corynebacterium sp. TaxID=159447 RepID=UPI0025E4B21B|nr:DUF3817 domain-containing protein [uncultured Corynebacterium sp.]